MIPILSVRNLSAGYGKRQVLFNVNLEVTTGEILLITGGNGSGKSTLLKAIFGLLPAWNSDAEIIFRPDPNGPGFHTHPPTLNLSKGLAYLPQKNAVFDDLTVEDNLHLAANTLRDRESSVRRREVLHALPALNALLRRKPGKMSGGERQMVALGMLLLQRPMLLLLDEPTAGLDSRNSDAFLKTLQALHSTRQLTFIVVEHRQHECASLGGRLCRMRLGKLEDDLTKCEPQSVQEEKAAL